MNYEQLLDIVNKRITCTSDNIPQNAFDIALQLNIRLKNHIECKRDFPEEKYPLKNTDAILALNSGEHTVYYDENYQYSNFAIAHEIAHYLLEDTSDGAEQHHDVQLMAAIIVAPAKLVRRHHIKSAAQLSELCKIPATVAELYWNEIIPNRQISFKSIIANPIIKYASISAVSIAAVLGAVQLRISDHGTEEQFPSTAIIATQQPAATYIPTSPPATPSSSPQEPEITPQTVYITSSGEKYHLAGCRHIKGSDVTELSVEEAVNLGKEPCKNCIK